MNLRMLLLLCAAHLLTDFNQGAIPIVGQHLREVRGLTFAQVGTLMLVSSACSSVVQPLLGIYSDRAKSGWLIPLGLAAAGTGLLGIAYATQYPWLLVSVALTGVGVAAFHPEGMRAAHFAAGGRRTTGMAIFQVGGNAGFGLGPAVAAALITLAGLRGLAWMALPALAWAAVMAASLRSVRALWEAPHPPGPGGASADGASPGTGAHRPPASVGGAARDRWGPALLVLVVVMLRAVFQFGLITFLPIYYVEVRGGSQALSGVILSLYLLSGALGTLLGGPVADRFGPRRYLIAAMAALAPLHLLTLLAPGGWMLLFLAAQGFALVSQYAVSIVLSQSYVPNRLALVSGLNVGLGMSLGGLGAAAAGLVADTVGLVPTLYGLSLVPVLGAAVAAALPAEEEPAARVALARGGD